MNQYDKIRYEVMRNLIKSDNQKTILDIGAGRNPLSAGIESKKTITIDGNRDFGSTIVSDLNNDFPIQSESIDIVLAGEIVEHLINPYRFILEIKRVLKKGGSVILSTPNIASLKNRLLLMFGSMPSNNALAYPSVEDHKFYHKSDWTLKHICRFLETAGLKVELKTSSGLFFKNLKLLSNKDCPPQLGEILIIKAIK